MATLIDLKAERNSTSTFQSWKRLFSYFKPHKLMIGIAIFSLCIFSFVDAGMIYFIKPLVDEGLTQSNSSTLKIGALLVVLIFLVRGLASFIYNYMMAYISNLVTFEIRQQAFATLQKLPMTFFDAHNRGTLISKLIYDSEQISKATSSALITAFRESLIVVVLLGMMFYASWQLSLIFIIIGPLIGVVISLVTKRFKQVSNALQNSMGEITKVAEQSLSNHQEVLVYTMADDLSEQFQQINNRNRQQMMKLAVASALSNPTIQLIASFSIAAVLLLASSEQILANITAGTFTMVLFAICSLLRPLKQLTTVNQQLQRGIAAAESLFELLDKPLELDIGNVKLAGEQFSIQFKQLNFSYSGKEPVINNLSMTIPAQQSFAIVGETGSGKSTLVSLILRLYTAPKSTIFINDVPIEQITLSSLRSKVSFVSQHIVLFDDSLANNILFGCQRKVSREELELVASDANVMSFAATMPLGLDSPVGENGCLLSGGQRQRIAIARAMLKDTPIVILDEATSALDNRSEFLIQEAFARLGKHKTMLIIAHRLSTIENADQILVLEKGNLVEQGTHAELLLKRGTYLGMHQQQFAIKES